MDAPVPRSHKGADRARPGPAPSALAKSSYREEPRPFGEAMPVTQPVIRVVGVGGAGTNAVNRMVEAEVEGVEFLAINTDLQSLQQSTADITLHIGAELTRGLGSGSDAEVGSQAAMDDYDRVKALLKGSDMIFITAGAGGGTGTGAAPIVARIAREVGALTVAIVTKPFGFEGSRRAEQAERGVEALGRGGGHADCGAQQPAADRPRQGNSDGGGVQGRRRRVAPGRAGHLRPGDPARPDQPRLRRRAHDHVRRRQRPARDRHGRRARTALPRPPPKPSPRRCSKPQWTGARSILLSITGGRDLSLWEVNEAAKAVSEAAHPDANIIFGAMVDEKLDDQVWVTVVATGYGVKSSRPQMREPGRRATRQAHGPLGARRQAVERRAAAASWRLAVSDMDVPEFIPNF